MPVPMVSALYSSNLNGQPREVEIRDKSLKAVAPARTKADPAKPGEVGAPIPGAVTLLHVKSGQHVEKGERLLVMEAMKMQTDRLCAAQRDGEKCLGRRTRKRGSARPVDAY